MQASMPVLLEVPSKISVTTSILKLVNNGRWCSPELPIPAATILRNGINFPSASFCGLLKFFGDKESRSMLLLLVNNRNGASLALCTRRACLMFGRHFDAGRMRK
jgi:hypothetical protein